MPQLSCQNHRILLNKATKLINKRTFRIQNIPFIVHVRRQRKFFGSLYIKRFINLKLSKILCNICVNNLKSPVISNTRSIRKNSFMRSLHFLQYKNMFISNVLQFLFLLFNLGIIIRKFLIMYVLHIPVVCKISR